MTSPTDGGSTRAPSTWEVMRHSPRARTALLGFGCALAGTQTALLLMVWDLFNTRGYLAAGSALGFRSIAQVLTPPVLGQMYDRFTIRRIVQLSALLLAAASLVLVLALAAPASTVWDSGVAAATIILITAAAVLEQSVGAITVTAATATDTRYGDGAAIGVGWAFDTGKIAAGALLILCLLLPTLGAVVVAAASALGGLAVASACRANPPSSVSGHVRVVLAHVGPPLLLLGLFCVSGGQMLWFQVLTAGDNFNRFIAIAIVVAAGAIAGNYALNRRGATTNMLRSALIVASLGLVIAYSAAAHDTTTATVAGMAGIASWGWSAAVVMQGLRVLILVDVPEELRGRVNGLFGFVNRAGVAGGSLLLGAIGATGGGLAVLLFAAGLCAMCVVIPLRQRAHV